MERTTVCYIRKENQVLMLFRNKRKQDINQGKWIGIGGHFEGEETPEECVLREVYEETGYLLPSVELRAELTVFNDAAVEKIYVFAADFQQGTLSECSEGTLAWIPIEKLFDLSMWEADRIFLPKILNGDPFFKMTIYYRQNQLIRWKEE